MKEILLLNLGRYGDLIQTTPLLRRLKATYPAARVTLVSQKRFCAILPLMSGFDRSILFDQDGLTRSLATAEGIPAAYGSLEELMAGVTEVRYDLAVNLTSSEFSAHFMALLDSTAVAGKTSDETGTTVVESPWALYLYSFLRGDSRRYNRINLSDIFCKMAGLQPDGAPVELHETPGGHQCAASFLSGAGSDNRPLVGLQLGASDATRCWPVASFARLSDMLQGTGVRTVLLGSPAERPLAEEARALMKHEPIDAVGKTDIQRLFSLLRHCSLLVSNDTGTMHFAAAGGVPTVMLTVGPASFFGTGPLSAGNLALQAPLPCSPCRYDVSCGNPVCRESITVEAVHNACRLLLAGGDAKACDTGPVRLFRSNFDPDGYLEWQSLRNGDVVLEKLTLRYARLWKKVLGSRFEVQGSECEVQGSRFKVQGSGFNASEPLFPELVRLTEEGCTVAQKIVAAARKSPLPRELGPLGEKEAIIESSLRCLAGKTPELSPLVDFMTIMKESIAATDLPSIAAATHEIYDLGNRLGRLL